MRLRFYQKITVRQVWKSPAYRDEEGWYRDERTLGNKVLQFYNKDTEAWEDLPLVIEEVRV